MFVAWDSMKLKVLQTTAVNNFFATKFLELCDVVPNRPQSMIVPETRQPKKRFKTHAGILKGNPCPKRDNNAARMEQTHSSSRRSIVVSTCLHSKAMHWLAALLFYFAMEPTNRHRRKSER